jgi:hypothetical protein
MNARGTRRPHARRVRKQPRRRVTSGSSGTPAGKTCPLSFVSIPVGLARGLLAEWQLRAMGGAR